MNDTYTIEIKYNGKTLVKTISTDFQSAHEAVKAATDDHAGAKLHLTSRQWLIDDAIQYGVESRSIFIDTPELAHSLVDIAAGRAAENCRLDAYHYYMGLTDAQLEALLTSIQREWSERMTPRTVSVNDVSVDDDIEDDIEMSEFDTMVDILGMAGFAPSSYSGRSMYGKECISIRCDDIIEATSNITEAAMNAAADDGYDASVIKGSHTDSMGLSYVMYWPRIEWQNA